MEWMESFIHEILEGLLIKKYILEIQYKKAIILFIRGLWVWAGWANCYIY